MENLNNDTLHSQSRFVRAVVSNLKNDWRRAYLEAAAEGAVVVEIRTRRVVFAWRPGP